MLFVLINSAASCGWDFLMDWALWQSRWRREPLVPYVPCRLREQRLYPALLYPIFAESTSSRVYLGMHTQRHSLRTGLTSGWLGLVQVAQAIARDSGWGAGWPRCVSRERVQRFVFSLLEIYRRAAVILLRLEWQWVNHHKMRLDPEELANPEPETPPPRPRTSRRRPPCSILLTTSVEMDAF